MEAGRPDTITAEKLAVLKARGVTRVSVNPQTMKQKTLDLIGRQHTPEQTVESFWLARELGFDNINMDLIVGLPGETIEGKDGIIYIDGEPLKQDYTEEVSEDDFGPYTVPEGAYFMMGDNRNDSWDSRYWEHKFVELQDIIGKAAVSYFPHPRVLK